MSFVWKKIIFLASKKLVGSKFYVLNKNLIILEDLGLQNEF